MDTLPFNLILFAIDLSLLGVLYLWGNKRLWFLAVFIDFVMIKGVSYIFRFGYGQNIVEGVFWHFGPFLFISGIILYAKKFRYTACVSMLCGAALVLLGIDCMLYEPYALTVENYKIVSPKVKEPIRVVFIADTQTDTISDYEIRAFRKMNQLKPDLLIFGGDYLQVYGRKTSQEQELHERFRNALQAEKFDPPLGAFAICGNNEAGEKNFQLLFENTGFQAISKTKTIDLGPVVLSVLSLWDSTLAKYYNGKRPKVFLKTDEEKEKFHIMAGHVPSFALVETDADLLLAGHTHGGQVIIPFYGAILTGSPTRGEAKYPRSWVSGMHTLPNGSRLIVTRGIGMERGWAPRIRFLCKPEISVIDIVPEK